jgi:hypothetical protein
MPVFRVLAEDRERLANAAAGHLPVGSPRGQDTAGYPDPAPPMADRWADAVMAMVGDDFEAGVVLDDPEQAAALEAWVAEHAPGAVIRS